MVYKSLILFGNDFLLVHLNPGMGHATSDILRESKILKNVQSP